MCLRNLTGLWCCRISRLRLGRYSSSIVSSLILRALASLPICLSSFMRTCVRKLILPFDRSASLVPALSALQSAAATGYGGERGVCGCYTEVEYAVWEEGEGGVDTWGDTFVDMWDDTWIYALRVGVLSRTHSLRVGNSSFTASASPDDTKSCALTARAALGEYL